MKLYSLRFSLPLLSLLACGGPSPVVEKPTNTPHAVVKAPEASQPPPAAERGNSVLLGWYCPEAAAGRPAIRPLFARDPSWASELAPLNQAIASRRVKRFTVMAWQGHAAGSLVVMGSAQDSKGKMAMGSYVGASTCQPRSTTGSVDAPDDDPVCRSLSDGCGLALGAIEDAGGFNARPYEEDPARLELFRSEACETEDVLHLDTDGDGKLEHFSISDLRGSGPAPVELPLAETSTSGCDGNFAAAVSDQADLVRMAVLDVDGDGRVEVLYRRNASELLLYGAPHSPARLELLGRQSLTVATP